MTIMKSPLLALSAVVLLFGGLSNAQARPVTVASFFSVCDHDGPSGRYHELGWGPSMAPGDLDNPFPDNQDISSTAGTGLPVPCPNTNDGREETLVAITNHTGLSWIDLWFVADFRNVLSNRDAFVLEVGPPIGVAGDAFRIDNIGVNKPLTTESVANNLIFEPNETWTFVIQDWVSPGAVSFGSLGVGGVSGMNLDSNASIIARKFGLVITEPASLALMGLGLAGLALAAAARGLTRLQTHDSGRRRAAAFKLGAARAL